MERPYRRFVLLSAHDGSKYPGVSSILTYGVVTLDMAKIGCMLSCDFSKAVVLGLAENPSEVKDNLEDIFMVAHGSLMDFLGDMDIDLAEVVLV